jgi:hypothetical protein
VAATFAALAAAVFLVYAWLLSAGGMRSWYCYTAYYDLLGDAFRHGQLHLRLRPDPALFTLADPYDPVQNQPYRLHDALLYGGRFYFYNGPAPAVVLAGLQSVYRGTVGDQHVLFAAAVALAALSAVLLEVLRRALYPGLPWWVLLPGVLVAALAHPLPLLLARAAIYEAALALAQVCLLAGLTALFTALCPAAGVPSPAPRRGRLLAAGIFLALAACTRASLAPAVAGLACLAAWRIYRLHRAARQPWAAFARSVAVLAAPLVLGALAHGAYNHARFGSWHEFGVRYQLAGYNVHAVTTNGGGLVAKYVPANFYAFTAHRPVVTPTFPYLTIPPVVYRGAVVHGEPIAGAAWAVPYLWLALVPVGLLLGGLRRGLSEREAARDWFVLCLLTAGLVGMAPTLFLDGCANRYLGDAAPSLLVLATLGGWEGLSRLRSRPNLRRAWLGALAGCTLATVVLGVLLGAYYVRYAAGCRARVPSVWYPANYSGRAGLPPG